MSEQRAREYDALACYEREHFTGYVPLVDGCGGFYIGMTCTGFHFAYLVEESSYGENSMLVADSEKELRQMMEEMSEYHEGMVR